MSTTIDLPAGSSQAVHIPLHRPIKTIFFITIRGAKRVRWDEKCDQALLAIKQYLIELLIWASPGADDTLYLYLVVSKVSISAALFTEDENRK